MRLDLQMPSKESSVSRVEHSLNMGTKEAEVTSMDSSRIKRIPEGNHVPGNTPTSMAAGFVPTSAG